MSARSGPGRGAVALGAMAAAAAGTYLAERATVARWHRGSDPCRHEPRSLTGAAHRLEGPDGTVIHAMLSGGTAPEGTVSEGTASGGTAPGGSRSDGTAPDGSQSGESPMVVLAHGYTATSHHWAPVAARLVARGARVVTYDQRGHGRSSTGPGRFGPEQLATDLRTVVDALVDGSGAVLVGHSMGGIGVQAGLAHHPEVAERTVGLVLVSTVARPVPVPLGRLMGRLGGTALARRTMAHRVHGRILARGGLGRDPALTAIDVVRHGWVTCADETRAGVMRDLRDYDFSEVLTSVEVPVTILCGDRDRVTPPGESRRLAGLVSHGLLDIVPGCGHALPWEAADRVAEAIITHVEGRTTLDRPETGAA